jgi:hypothetical protein
MNSMIKTSTRTQILFTPQATERPSFSSRIASNSDPDLLIREYFRKSDQQRTESRSHTVHFVRDIRNLIEVLSQSVKARNGFDGAVNLLAELENPQLFSEFSEALKTCRMAPPEIWIEIVIKAIACAYKIPTPQRFALLDSFSPVGRMIKAGIIDAMLIIADPNDRDTLNLIRDKVASFLSDHDQYIAHYAQEALDDLP